MYLTNFKNNEDIISQYDAPKDALDGATVYLAWYGYANYEGQSLVIFEKDGKLWEVNGAHCSCYGLEGQWEPEETSWESLKMRKISGDGAGSFEAQAILDELIVQATGDERDPKIDPRVGDVLAGPAVMVEVIAVKTRKDGTKMVSLKGTGTRVAQPWTKMGDKTLEQYRRFVDLPTTSVIAIKEKL